ncbi:hypothetical protein [Achromobacter phage Motura]|uniref:Uncharacterized protein n=1 Tax=Achromobacter phage Motura TaxID=2591403 RepID=A0A514CSN7_9CAUD|nr:hypothetical protein H1O15_gp321 [Achromobacter phage Motura]QDH83485.1 hypothetical protein [Achromobacter phage Motura]
MQNENARNVILNIARTANVRYDGRDEDGNECFLVGFVELASVIALLEASGYGYADIEIDLQQPISGGVYLRVYVEG